MEQDLFGNISINQQNPLYNRRVGFIGTFMKHSRAELIRKVKAFGAKESSTDGLTRDTQILIVGSDVKQETINRLLCYEHDGWKPLMIKEKDLLDIFNGHYAGYETPPLLKKKISIDMSYYNWTPPVYIKNDNDIDDTGVRFSSPLVYGEDNPISGMEIYVPNRQDADKGVIRQLIGNFGGYANREYYDDTNVIMLSEDTLQLLEKGIKDEIINEIETRYNESSAKMFNIQFTSEQEFIRWVKKRMEKYPDEGTIEMLKKLCQGAGE